MTAATFNSGIDRLIHSRRGKIASTWIRRLFLGGILAYLGYQFTDIGWEEILRSLPRTPWFYLLFLVNYVSLPVTEVLLYRWSWKLPFWKGIGTFLKKRVLNKDAIGYSGEVYLYLWARQNLVLTDRQLVGTLKDNTIVSSAVSTVFALLVLTILFFSGQIAYARALTAHDEAYAVLGLLVLIALGFLAVRFRRNLFHLPGRHLLVILFVHLFRLTLIHAVQVAQWAVVMPEVPLRAWLTFLTVTIISARIPFLPGRDLLSLGVNVELAQMMDISEAAVSGMMLVSAVLDKSINFISFTLLSVWKGKAEVPLPVEPPAADILDIPDPEPNGPDGMEPLQAQTL